MVTVTGTAAVSAVHGGASTHAKPVAKGAPLPGHASPLVTTITRIVGVVPTPIKVVIALLVALALAMAARTRLAARRARRLELQRGELLEDVGLLQAALLPLTPERLGPVGTSVAYRPAAGPGAGGDFYDVFALEDGKIAVIVGDVSGHGRKALPHTALMRFTLRAYLEAGLSPRGAVQTAGTVLDHQLEGSFATVVVATYNPRERRLVYASAGHPPPLVRGLGADDQPLEPVTISSSPPVGVGMPTGTRQTVVSVPGAAQICFFTDGVTEARVGGDLYGVQRLGAALIELGPQTSAPQVLDHVAESTDRRPDDMAACLLRVEGGEDQPRLLTEELELDRKEATSERTERFLLDCGVTPLQTAEVMRSASIAAEGRGSVVLELHHQDKGAPTVSLQQDNLAYLQTRHAAHQADLRVSV
jgi:serine phosphatase RsbU (regulator of sigma subunit)